jgi:hypothetical protein
MLEKHAGETSVPAWENPPKYLFGLPCSEIDGMVSSFLKNPFVLE